MLNKMLESVERFVMRPNRMITIIDKIFSKVLPQNIALANHGCPTCGCGPNCKVQQPVYVLINGHIYCICGDTTINCQPC